MVNCASFWTLSFLRASTFELRHLQQMPQLGSLCLEIFGIMRIGLSLDRYLLDHFEAVSLEADNFLRVICQESELSHAEVEKNLRTQAVIAQVAGISQFRVGLYSIETFLLQLVGMNFCRQPDAASFLAHVNQNAVAFLGNLPERRVQLISTVAPARSKDVAGETLAVHAHQRRLAFVDLPFDQREVMLPIES